MDLHSRIEQKLNQRKKEGTFRSLISNREGIDFWSNDYLGFAKIIQPNNDYEKGSTGSRLISGNSFLIEETEQKLAHFFNAEAGLIFNSGYDANVGLLSCLPQKNDLVFYDEHIHASIRDGIRLSFAKSFSFQHNSLEDLAKKLQINTTGEGLKFVCIESIYSMGGDIPPFSKIIALCKENNAYLIVDEAHAGGVYGKSGEGIISALGLEEAVFARIFTFGKAFGCHGAIVLGSQKLREYLINYSRAFIYTTAPAPASVHLIAESVQRIEFSNNRKKLFENIIYFRELCDDSRIDLISEVNSPIQMLRMSREKVTQKAEELRKQGLLVKAIVSPTVKSGEEAIRVCIHSFNTKIEIETLVSALC